MAAGLSRLGRISSAATSASAAEAAPTVNNCWVGGTAALPPTKPTT